MKPFNLEAAKAGDPILDICGHPMRFVAHLPEADEENRVICLDSSGYVHVSTEDGCEFAGGQPALFMGAGGES